MQAQTAEAHALAGQAQEQTKEMKESVSKTDSLIRATSRLAEQSKRSADLSQSIFDATVRPYIGMDSLAPPIFDAKTHTILIRSAVKNFGSAPAFNYTIHTRWFLNGGGIKPPWGGGDDIFKKTIFPGQPMVYEIRFSDPVLYQEVAGGSNALSVCFVYSYFGPKTRHYEENQSAMYAGMDGPVWTNWGECPNQK